MFDFLTLNSSGVHNTMMNVGMILNGLECDIIGLGERCPKEKVQAVLDSYGVDFHSLPRKTRELIDRIDVY